MKNHAKHEVYGKNIDLRSLAKDSEIFNSDRAALLALRSEARVSPGL